MHRSSSAILWLMEDLKGVTGVHVSYKRALSEGAWEGPSLEPNKDGVVCSGA